MNDHPPWFWRVHTETEQHVFPFEPSGLRSPAGPSLDSRPAWRFSPSVAEKPWSSEAATNKTTFKLQISLGPHSDQLFKVHQFFLLLVELLGFHIQDNFEALQLLLQIQDVRVLLHNTTLSQHNCVTCSAPLCRDQKMKRRDCFVLKRHFSRIQLHVGGAAFPLTPPSVA